MLQLIKRISFIALLSVMSFKIFALDLLQVYQLAVQQDPTLKTTFNQYFAQKAIMHQARANLLPNINANHIVTSQATGHSDSFNTHSLSATITQPIIRLDLFAELARTNALKKQARFDYLDQEQTLIVRVADQYFAILAKQDNITFTIGQQKAFKRQLDEARQKFDVGLIPITDVEEAKARYDQAKADVIQAENEYNDEKQSLYEIINVVVDEIAPTNGVNLETPSPQDQNIWVNTARNNNKSLLASNAGLKASCAEVKSAYAEHLPTATLNGSVARQKNARPLSEYVTNKSASLTLSLPIFTSGSTLAKTRQASYQYQAALNQHEKTLRAVQSNTRQAFRGVITAISRVKALRQALVSSQSALKATRAAYKVGSRTIVDVLDAQTNVLRAKRDLNFAKYDYILNSLKLKQQAGILSIQDIEYMNGFLH